MPHKSSCKKNQMRKPNPATNASWQSILARHSADLEAIGIDRETYFLLAKNIRLDHGLTLEKFILERLLLVTSKLELVAIQVLAPTLGHDKTLQYWLSYPDDTERVTATQELIAAGKVLQKDLGDGRLCFYMPFPQDQEVTTPVVLAWHKSVLDHYVSSLSGLRAA
jgi:hypothetical protein